MMNELELAVPVLGASLYVVEEPADAVLGKDFVAGLQFGLVEVEVVDCADAEDRDVWPAGAGAVHEGAARLAKVVGHGVA